MLALFDAGLRAAAVLLLSALLVVVLAGVVTRSYGEPLMWTDEVARVVMIWLAVCGWLLASRRRGHIRIRFFVDKLPPTARRAAEVVLQAGVTLFGALVACYGATLVTRNLDLEATTIPVSMSVMYAPVVLAGAVTALQGLAQTIEAARGR